MLNHKADARHHSPPKINLIQCIFLLAILTSLVILTVQTQAIGAELYGVVYPKEGPTRAEIKVQIGTVKGEVLQSTKTNNQGMYQFGDLHPGIHLIRCQGHKWEKVYVEPGHSRYDLYPK